MGGDGGQGAVGREAQGRGGVGEGACEGQSENQRVLLLVLPGPFPSGLCIYLLTPACSPSRPLLAILLPGAALISDIDKLLTELPSSEAQQLRKDAASIIAAVGAQRSAVEKAMQQVGKY